LGVRPVPHGRRSDGRQAREDSLPRQRTGRELAQAHARTLETLSTQPGLVGTIYTRARNTIEEPAHLHRLVRMIGAEN
jgi:hypothetical protein